MDKSQYTEAAKHGGAFKLPYHSVPSSIPGISKVMLLKFIDGVLVRRKRTTRAYSCLLNTSNPRQAIERNIKKPKHCKQTVGLKWIVLVSVTSVPQLCTGETL